MDVTDEEDSLVQAVRNEEREPQVEYEDAKDGGVCSCSSWWMMAVLTLLIGAVGLVAISVLMGLGDVIPDRYGVVMDAGSTHTEVLVFAWRGNKYNGTGLVEQVSSCKINVAISSYRLDPDDAGSSIKPCLDQVVSTVPTSLIPATPVYMGATAGMRLLNISDPLAVLKILDSIRATISTYKLQFRPGNARIITGREEGTYSWITVNYIMGTFGVTMTHHESIRPAPVAHLQPSYGALDLGGASTQITFEAARPQLIPRAYLEHVVLFGRTYNVFTDTFLCYGKTMAHLRHLAALAIEQNSTTVTNPCFPAGYSEALSSEDLFSSPCTQKLNTRLLGRLLYTQHGQMKNVTFTFSGQSNTIQCQVEVKKMFGSGKCPYDNNCSWNQHFLPPYSANKFLAFSGFYWVMKAYNFTDGYVDDHSLASYQKAVAILCTRRWNTVRMLPFDRPNMAAYNCFDGHFVEAMLTNGGYHFNEATWESIDYVNQIDGTSTGWAMGYMLNQTSSLLPAVPQKRIDIPVFIALMIIFSVLVALSVAFACYARKSGTGLGAYKNSDGYGTV